MNSNFIACLMLATSITSEVIGTIALKHPDGFVKLIPTLIFVCCYLSAACLMGLAMRRLDIRMTYAILASLSAAITSIIGITYFGEHSSVATMSGLFLVSTGVLFLYVGASE